MNSTKNILYVFGGEFASGGEFVIERLMLGNYENSLPHLFLSPGTYYEELSRKYDFPIKAIKQLRKLNRAKSSLLNFIFNAIYNYLSVSYLVLKYISKNKINVIHANTLGPASYLIPAILFTKIFNKKIIWIWSDHDLVHHSKLDYSLIKICSGLYNNTLVVSQAVKNKYDTNNQKIIVLYNGLDPDFFVRDNKIREEFRIKYNISNSVTVVGIAGFIAPRKGQITLCKSVINLIKEYPDLLLLIAGKPLDLESEYYKELVELISRVDYIKYVGQIKDMRYFYNGCDILVNNSNIEGSEPLGTTIYESMSCSKVVIASKTGGTSEIITDGFDGFLFDAENMESFERHLARIISKPDMLSEIKLNARNKVLKRFNIKTMVFNYNQIINALKGA